MAQTKREVYETAREKLQQQAGNEGELTETEAEQILEWCAGYDGENATATPNDADHDSNRWGDTRAPSTLRQWIMGVKPFALEYEGLITDASADELNQVAQRLYDGPRDLSKNTIRSKQNCLKKFLRHTETEADPDDIMVFDMESTVVDPADMLTPEEFHALRRAPEHPRDRALIHMFLYTGQRNNAIRTLRIRDVDLENERYRLNSDAGGLKGAELVGTWNPLLGATGALRDWFDHHPAPDDPDAYVFCERRDSLFRNPHETISDDTVNRVIREAAEKAAQEEPGIEDKPTHAHALRHNFVTICKRDYDMDDDVIKRMIRHKPESDVMNTTYAHLSDEDYIQKAEEAMGYRKEEEQSTMTPETCNTCREPLPPNAKACPSCGTALTPDAKQAEDSLREREQETKEQADSFEEYKDADAIAQAIREDPKLAAELMEKLDDLSE